MSVFVENDSFLVRHLEEGDFPGIQNMCEQVYPFSKPWTETQLVSHLKIFPQGQLVAVQKADGSVVGMASSLIVNWEDYEVTGSWKDFTDAGMFTNHDPSGGKTLYGAEVMVCPNYQGHGVGKMLYSARRKLVRELGLLRIRAGARLRGYGTYAEELSARDYLLRVVNKQVFDPTVSFQIKEGFRIVALVPKYLANDTESLGYAVVIEWLNPEVALREHYKRQAEYSLRLFGDLVDDVSELYSAWKKRGPK